MSSENSSGEHILDFSVSCCLELIWEIIGSKRQTHATFFMRASKYHLNLVFWLVVIVGSDSVLHIARTARIWYNFFCIQAFVFFLLSLTSLRSVWLPQNTSWILNDSLLLCSRFSMHGCTVLDFWVSNVSGCSLVGHDFLSLNEATQVTSVLCFHFHFLSFKCFRNKCCWCHLTNGISVICWWIPVVSLSLALLSQLFTSIPLHWLKI